MTVQSQPADSSSGPSYKTPGPSPRSLALDWHVFGQPHFLTAFVVLFAAALTFNAATQFLKLNFRKEAVPLRKPIDTIPSRLGPWLKLTKDEPLDREMQDVLGTDKYVFRDYVDTRRVNLSYLQKIDPKDFPAPTSAEAGSTAGGAAAAKDLQTALEDKSSTYLNRIGAVIQSNDSSAVVRVAVTYYTGLVDTVAHIPDRCYVADGYEPTSYTTPTWNVGAAATGGGDGKLQLRLINFEDAAPDRGAVTKNVAYFFHCNGAFESDPIYGVRVRLQNLFERRGYYAKVELMTVSPREDQMASPEIRAAESARTAGIMTDFLSNAMPEILKCLPDWKAVTATNPTK
jgi:hypothetical protein